MNVLSEILQTATAGVEARYFHLQVAGGTPVYRERVYCYELYHQMRKNWPVDCQFHLNGEVDKQAHPILRRLGADSAKPDFLIHNPGAMERNYAIIEVKHSMARAGVEKDLRTLDLFVREVRYQRAIYLIYGSQANTEGVEQIKAIANNLQINTPIEMWLHSEVNQQAKHYATLPRTVPDR
ncbi:MAG: hypothetical protein IT422_02090 [Pirellulaceae bacterium]|nr:hypothetical protein [Pirellulaceae bacterium]